MGDGEPRRVLEGSAKFGIGTHIIRVIDRSVLESNVELQCYKFGVGTEYGKIGEERFTPTDMWGTGSRKTIHVEVTSVENHGVFRVVPPPQ